MIYLSGNLPIWPIQFIYQAVYPLRRLAYRLFLDPITQSKGAENQKIR